MFPKGTSTWAASTYVGLKGYLSVGTKDFKGKKSYCVKNTYGLFHSTCCHNARVYNMYLQSGDYVAGRCAERPQA